jgi:hypothetical protein
VIATHAGAILVITGAITAAAAAVTLAPDAALDLIFGARSVDSLTRLIARHWGLLVGLIGALLIYAAYHPDVRVPIMVAAIAEKLAIGALIFASPFRKARLALAVAIVDPVIAVIYVTLLATPYH